MLYYAQGVTLSVLNRPLFKEKIMAWEHGPVVTEVYDVFKDKGRKSLEIELTEKEEMILNLETDENISSILNLVYDNFAIYTAWQLREMTHVAGAPWTITVKNKGLNHEISLSLIKDYFDKYVME